jgi:hypothetical protein
VSVFGDCVHLVYRHLIYTAIPSYIVYSFTFTVLSAKFFFTISYAFNFLLSPNMFLALYTHRFYSLSLTGEGEIFLCSPKRSDLLCGPPSLLSSENRGLFQRGETVRFWDGIHLPVPNSRRMYAHTCVQPLTSSRFIAKKFILHWRRIPLFTTIQNSW